MHFIFIRNKSLKRISIIQGSDYWKEEVIQKIEIKTFEKKRIKICAFLE